MKEVASTNEGSKYHNLITIISLLVITISVGGVRIEEANTFIFKLSFTNPENIGLVLAISLVTLCIRRFSIDSSSGVHTQLRDAWIQKLIKDWRVLSYDQENDEAYGYAVKVNEKNMDPPARSDTLIGYRSRGFLTREFVYESEFDEDFPTESYEYCKDIRKDRAGSFRIYTKVVSLEIKYRIGSWFTDPAVLDFYGPYLLAATALILYFVPGAAQVFH